ncbi:MAG: DNA primase [Pirellulales bacterium]
MIFDSANDAKEQVRQATDIVDLVGSYVELRRQGRGFVARCPWHDDRRPSLNVNPDRQTWRCWVCNIGGDCFEWVMQKERVEFRDALQILADRAGITLVKQRGPEAKPGSPDDKATLYSAVAWAEQLFRECLLHSPQAAAARDYLAGRGITADSIDRFRLGYSPDSWTWLIEQAGRSRKFSTEVLEACGLVGRSQSGSEYDRFRGRVIFPIHDTQRRPIAFGGRVLPGSDREGAKYVNSPETRLFTKSDNLYAFDLARDVVQKERSVVVVEGYTDVVLAHQSGVTNVVAVLGTAINQRHIRLLRRFAETIYLVLDGDVAGQRRTNEVLELFVAEAMDLRIMTLPEGQDPADFFLSQGAEAFRQMLGTAVDALEHRIRVSTHGVNLTVDTHRANQALEQIVATVARTPRDMNAAPNIMREHQILTRLARAFSVDEEVLRQRAKELRGQQAKSGTRPSEPEGPQVQGPPIMLRSLPPEEVELLEIAVVHPELAPMAFAAVRVDELKSPHARLLFNSMKLLHDQGEPLDFNHVLGELEDGRLKSLLVEIDESARAKDAVALEPAESRMKQLCERLAARRDERERRETRAALETGKLDFQKEIEALKKLFEDEKHRRGLGPPTEG